MGTTGRRWRHGRKRGWVEPLGGRERRGGAGRPRGRGVLGTAVVPVILAGLLSAGVLGSIEPAARPVAATTPRTTTIALYWLRSSGTLGVSHRTIPATAAIGAASLRALLGGPTRAERAAGLSSAVPSGSRLLHLAVAKGVARADLNARFASGGGSLSVIGRLDQVVYTLTQFPSIRRVLLLVDGKVVRTFTGEGLVLDHPVGRVDERSLLPAVFLEHPAVGDTLRSPFRVAGLANTSRGVFSLQLVDAAGRTVTSRVVHVPAGAGMWDTFSVLIPYDGARAGMGKVVAFERSARDGRPVHVVRIPVRIAG